MRSEEEQGERSPKITSSEGCKRGHRGAGRQVGRKCVNMETQKKCFRKEGGVTVGSLG